MTVDPRLVFLARAEARLILVEAGEIDLDEALDGLVEPACDHDREWIEALVGHWEHTHPPRKHRRRAHR
jgi:hypothetical protein